MRIVIETDESDKQQSAHAVGLPGSVPVLDGGPAPVALLRRMGRVPDIRGEDEYEDDESKLNPLRQGSAVAGRRYDSGDRAAAGNDAMEGDDQASDDPPGQ